MQNHEGTQEAVTRVDLVLASSSPRRQSYFQDLGLDFTVAVADLDETPLPDELPIQLAERLAAAKAQAVAARLPAGASSVIVAADTVVALDDLILGKPRDAAEAWQMLDQLRDGPHQVYSAVSVLDARSGAQSTQVNTTTVVMRAYSDDEIAAYIATGDPLDKAGAYAVQHPEFAPARAVVGCLSGVVGLPLGELRDLLQAVGIHVGPVVNVCEAKTRFGCCQRGVAID